MSIHPEVLKMIEAGPRPTQADSDGWVRGETPEEFARRIAALAVQKEREALKPKIMPSVGVAIGTRLRDFYKNRFALVTPVQHTDNERQVILAALESLLAALTATHKEEGNG